MLESQGALEQDPARDSVVPTLTVLPPEVVQVAGGVGGVGVVGAATQDTTSLLILTPWVQSCSDTVFSSEAMGLSITVPPMSTSSVSTEFESMWSAPIISRGC